MKPFREMLPKFFVLCALLALAGAAFGADQEAETPAAVPQIDPIPVKEILTAGPVPLVLPAFHDEEKAGVKIDGLFEALPGLPQAAWPREGDAFAGPDGKIEWKKADAGAVWKAPQDASAARYAAFYVYTDRWQKAVLTVTGEHPVKAELDGAPLTLAKKEVEEGESAAPMTEQTTEMKLAIGKHLIVLRTMNGADIEADWTLGLSITPDAEAGAGSLTLCADPRRPVDIQVVLDAPRISRVGISPDGKLAAVALGEFRDGAAQESWIEIRDTKTGDLVHLWRGGESPSRLGWLPVGRKLGWQTSADGKTTVWVHDLETGAVTAVLEDVADLGSWRWAPDGESLFYEITRSPDPDSRKVKRVLHPADRQPWWRGRSHLMQVFVPGGMTRQLTAGPLSPGGWQISPDGKRLMFSTSEPALESRPFSRDKLWLMDLETLKAEMVLSDPWVGGAEFGPDPDVLLIQGSPSAFDGIGRRLPEGVQANDYGGQLFLYDLKKKEAEAITLDLVPDVGGMEWSLNDGKVYARTTDTQYNNVYRCDPKKRDWEKVDTGFESTSSIELPREGSLALAYGTSAATPNRLHVIDLKKNEPRLLLDPGADDYRDIVFGKVSNWAVTLEKGMELDGFVFYPPGFDESKKYPVIVYYYGGTSPITRDFGGRYPKNVWAGQGYVVYVPNPSGATGYGQEFAARHVNDWGILTADEVIEGTKAFLAAHPFADAERVGCMGASYGGFLTEYLVTQTDIFAAAVSHAGISDISSYWGEGLWGYVYGARALAHSFPWKDRELFIEQSPLFHADKITTPLLLVHGDSDTNVPKGESDQLFTALKLLGKEVEYVQVVGQDHWVLDHGQRIVWNDTILSFFAKHLKGREAWWNEMYPEPEDY